MHGESQEASRSRGSLDDWLEVATWSRPESCMVVVTTTCSHWSYDMQTTEHHRLLYEYLQLAVEKLF